MSQNKTYNKWLKRTLNHNTPWTENEIKYFRKIIGRYGIKDLYFRAQLVKNFQGPYQITEEQSIKGITYLRTKCLKTNGEARNIKNMPFGTFELNIIRNFYKFEFIGIYGHYNEYMNTIMNYSPVYRCYDIHGNYFDYIGVHFDLIEVLEIGSIKLRLVKGA